MSDYLLKTQDDVVDFRRTINSIRKQIEYDVINHDHNTEFEELEVMLDEVIRHLDKLYDKMAVHVYAFDVSVTVSRRVYVKASDEVDAEQAAIDYAISELDCSIDWNEDDAQVFRDEDEETTSVYDVEV